MKKTRLGKRLHIHFNWAQLKTACIDFLREVVLLGRIEDDLISSKSSAFFVGENLMDNLFIFTTIF